jgi:FkbM family methyltransferase
MDINKFLFNYKAEVRNYIIKEIFEENIYQIENNNLSTKCPIIIDCGANVGFSVAYFKSILPNCTIYAFEPDPETFKLLEKNVTNCNFEKVNIINQGLGGTKKNASFYTSVNSEYMAPVMSFAKNEYAQKGIEINYISLGDFLGTFDRVDLCKIDIEGSESIVIEDLIAKKVLNKVSTFIIEYHHWIKQKFSFDELVELLKVNGFEIHVVKHEPHNIDWETSGNTIIRAHNKFIQHI